MGRQRHPGRGERDVSHPIVFPDVLTLDLKLQAAFVWGHLSREHGQCGALSRSVFTHKGRESLEGPHRVRPNHTCPSLQRHMMRLKGGMACEIGHGIRMGLE